MQRRQFLSLIGLLALPFQPILAAKRPTPADAEGPFYPLSAIPLRSNLIQSSQLNEMAIQLSGRVLDKQGKPLKNAKVEIWQCDKNGIYDHPRQPQRETFDSQFLGFGSQLTDDEGGYDFTTLYPAPYTGRPPHIHVKIWHKNQELLTTQLYLKDNTGSSWYQALREPLQINPKQQPDGKTKATFTFIV